MREWPVEDPQLTREHAGTAGSAFALLAVQGGPPHGQDSSDPRTGGSWVSTALLLSVTLLISPLSFPSAGLLGVERRAGEMAGRDCRSWSCRQLLLRPAVALLMSAAFLHVASAQNRSGKLWKEAPVHTDFLSHLGQAMKETLEEMIGQEAVQMVAEVRLEFQRGWKRVEVKVSVRKVCPPLPVLEK